MHQTRLKNLTTIATIILAGLAPIQPPIAPTVSNINRIFNHAIRIQGIKVQAVSPVKTAKFCVVLPTVADSITDEGGYEDLALGITLYATISTIPVALKRVGLGVAPAIAHILGEIRDARGIILVEFQAVATVIATVLHLKSCLEQLCQNREELTLYFPPSQFPLAMSVGLSTSQSG